MVEPEEISVQPFLKLMDCDCEIDNLLVFATQRPASTQY